MQCPHCHKEFQATRSRKMFCSRDCSRAAARKIRQQNVLSRQAQRQPDTECAWCKTLFMPPQKSVRYCSPKCRQAARNQSHRLPPIQVTCLQCQTVFTCARKSVRKFCTPEHESLYRSNRTKGHPRTAETKLKMAQEKAAFWADPVRSSHARQAVSDRMRRNNPVALPEIREKIHTTKALHGTLDVIKNHRGGNGKISATEQILAIALPGWVWGYAVPLGPRMEGYPTCYKIDIANPALKIAIEVDGVSHLVKLIILRDAKKTAKLQELGWRVLRFTNKQVQTQLSWVLSEIQNAVKATSISTT